MAAPERHAQAFDPPPEYLPFDGGPFRMAMALRSLGHHDWFEIGPDRPAQMAEKRRLLRENHAAVFQSEEGSEVAAQELAELLADYLPTHFPAVYARDGETFRDRIEDQSWDLAASGLHPLDLAGRWVQEDLLLLQRQRADQPFRLIAGSLCFPTRWRLADKIGRPLRAIHDPVPYYGERLADPVDRFFDKLQPGHGVWRLNWSLLDDGALFQPNGHGRTRRDHGITKDNAGDKLWLRVERQTLRKLPHSGAVLFTVRVHHRPLSELSGRGEPAGRLAAAVRALPDPMRTYKSVGVFADALLAWLDRQAAEPGAAP